eukprot:6206065-Pleurochrysis_carterae.AAC.1
MERFAVAPFAPAPVSAAFCSTSKQHATASEWNVPCSKYGSGDALDPCIQPGRGQTWFNYLKNGELQQISICCVEVCTLELNCLLDFNEGRRRMVTRLSALSAGANSEVGMHRSEKSMIDFLSTA